MLWRTRGQVWTTLSSTYRISCSVQYSQRLALPLITMHWHVLQSLEIEIFQRISDEFRARFYTSRYTDSSQSWMNNNNNIIIMRKLGTMSKAASTRTGFPWQGKIDNFLSSTRSSFPWQGKTGDVFVVYTSKSSLSRHNLSRKTCSCRRSLLRSRFC